MESEFYTLGSFEFPADAHVIKGRLEAEGIPVFLRDENTINTDPFVSNALGGVKLQVYTRDRDIAIPLYDTIRSYATDDAGELLACPNCKAQRMEVYYTRKGVFLKLFPFFESKKYRCNQCKMITSL